MEKKYINNEDKTSKDKVVKSYTNKLECDCFKPTFQKKDKKECIDCMYKDILYLVP